MDVIDQASEQTNQQLSATLSRIQSIVAHMNTPLNTSGPRLCEDCGRNIPEQRLRAVPGAVRCVPCQELFETR